MKKRIRVFIASTLAVLLLTGAACAQDGDPAYYAPMESDAGRITIDSVYKLPPADGSTQTIQVSLSVPAELAAGIADGSDGPGDQFFILGTLVFGVFFPAEFSVNEDAREPVLTLLFSLPADGEAADYHFVYVDQKRALAKTGEEPGAFIASPAPKSAETGAETTTKTEEPVEASALAWPDTGELYHHDGYRSSALRLNIEISSQDSGSAAYIKIYSGDGTLVSTMFIAGSGTAGADLPAGVYSIKMGVGKAWYGEADAFGSDGYYETMLFDDEYTEVALEAGYSYTLLINTSMNDPDAEDVDSEYIDWSDF